MTRSMNATNHATRSAMKMRGSFFQGLLPGALLAVALLLSPVAAVAQDPGHEGHEGHGTHEAHGSHGSYGSHEGQGTDDPHAQHKKMLNAPVEVEKVGELRIPDLPVVTQDGEEVHFYSDLVADRVVAMNFIFTTCRTICPPLGANFGKLQDLLGERAGRDVHLISVSVDPVTDTPERLKAWGELFGAGPGWTLVTGTKTEVTKLLKSLQVFTPDFNDHSPVVLIGNAATGNWTRAYGLAPPKDLAAILGDLAEPHDAEPHDTEGGAR